MKASTARPPRKINREVPESLAQAQRWDANANRYRAARFCDTCASQAAWGHQLGFGHVRPVAPCCMGRTVPAGRGERAAR